MIFTEKVRLEAKTYQFPFQFKLPSQLPSSFEGEFGFIQYAVTISIDIPFQRLKEHVESIRILKMIETSNPELQVIQIKEGIFPEFKI